MNFEKLSFVGLSPTDYVSFYTVFEVQETLNVESAILRLDRVTYV